MLRRNLRPSMANLIRCAKSASRWTASDLAAYNIQVIEVNAQTFFGMPRLPASTFSPMILAHRYHSAARLPESENSFFRLLGAVMVEDSPESSVDSLAIHVLRLVGFCGNDQYINMQQNMPNHLQ